MLLSFAPCSAANASTSSARVTGQLRTSLFETKSKNTQKHKTHTSPLKWLPPARARCPTLFRRTNSSDRDTQIQSKEKQNHKQISFCFFFADFGF
jgi:hypothetical protein